MNAHNHSRRILLLWLWLVSTTTTFAFSAIANSNDPQSSSSLSSSSTNNKPPKVIPITILSGFLGSGKTTLLQNLLQNKQGLKVAVVVNDVASVNIDSKLVNQQQQQQQQSSTDGSSSDTTILELQNGCACCSQSDELLSTIGTLVTLSDLRKPEEQFQHIVVELSGVADPKLVRAKFQEAQYLQMTLLERVQLDTLVTLIDASAFESRFESTAIASRQETPELYFSNGGDEASEAADSGNPTNDQPELEDWMKELPPQLLQAVMGGNGQGENADEGSGVADLLVSQTETADVLVLNKCDLVSDDQRIELQQVIAALNPRATVLQTSFGKLSIEQILGVAKGQGASMSGDVDDHRDAVLAAQATTVVDLLTTALDNDNEEDGGHSHSHNDHASSSSSSTHSSHSHDHDENCNDPACTDPSHSHSHNHDHHKEEDCSDPTCTDPSHSHSHTHDHTTTTAEESSCTDPNCNDPNHSHSHSHNHHDTATETHAGIGSFVYRARRPFHPTRLTAFLQHLPVVRGVPNKQQQQQQQQQQDSLEVSADTKQMLQACLRSKGFCWIANSHVSATYWSHAGTSFELSCLGQWWATLPRELWPEGVEDYVLADFDDVHHTDDHDNNDDDNDSSNCSSSSNDTVGDRRQELVFIGNQYAKANCQAEITKALNQCLLNNEEYQEYQELLQEHSSSDEDKESALRAAFSSPLEAKIMSF